MFCCFFNLSHEDVRSQSQRQCPELARTSRMAYHGQSAPPASAAGNCYCCHLPSSSACSHCTLLPPPTKASGTQDTGCLAATSAQHIQGEPSQISLCYFKPTKDAGPLPHGHKYLTPAHTTLGCFPAPGLVFSQPRLQAGSAVWQVRSTGLGKPAPLSCEGPQSFRTGNKRGQPAKVMGLHVHYTPARVPGPHQGA